MLKSILLSLTLASYSCNVRGHECGTPDILETRILNGLETKRGEWPFLAALYDTDQSTFFCAATLISSKHVLTAAHCVQQKQSLKVLEASDVIVLLGRYNLTKIERGATQRDVDQIFVHPDWKPFDKIYDSDIAVFVLADIVDFSNLIRSVCLPVGDELIDDTEATIVGWGLAHTDSRSHEPIPRETTTWILNASYCSTVSPQLAKFASTRAYCGGGDDGSPNSGDSGGGLYIRSGFAWIQYGIISSTLTNPSGQRLQNSYSLYTSVFKHINWIIETAEITGGAISTKEDKHKENIEMHCEYTIDSVFYRCTFHNASITKQNVIVSNFTGGHLDGYSTNDVTEIWVWNGKFYNFPVGIGKLFKKLEKITVSYGDRNLGLKLLRRNTFKDMSNLWYLVVFYNKIEFIEEDALRDLSNLKTFEFSNNKVKRLYKSTFARNFLLMTVLANSNKLEYLHKDLFRNNPLLERVEFKNNELMTISIDFTIFNNLMELDFRGNKCIDKSLNSSLSDFQEFLTLNCS